VRPFVVREARVKRLLLVVVALVGVAGCGRGDQVPASTSAAPSQSSTVAMPAFLRVTGRPTDSMMAVVWRNGIATITSRLSGRKVTIAGRAGRYTRNGRLLAVVRNYRDGVRVKDARGITLWRARISRTQVQILRGETEVRYTFRPYGDDRIIVRQGTLLVGSVRAVENGAELVDARGVRLGMSSSRPGNDMAVLLCSEIPPDLRAILTAALLRRR
jgi:hypothetical protein